MVHVTYVQSRDLTLVPHETGYALGLGHTAADTLEVNGIMSGRFYFVDSLSYNDYTFFVAPDSLNHEQRWLIYL